MVNSINGEGYDLLRESYEKGVITAKSGIYSDLIPKGFFKKMREKFSSVIDHLFDIRNYVAREDLTCYFNDWGVLCSVDSGEAVGGKLEKLIGRWGAIAADQTILRRIK